MESLELMTKQNALGKSVLRLQPDPEKTPERAANSTHSRFSVPRRRLMTDDIGTKGCVCHPGSCGTLDNAADCHTTKRPSELPATNQITYSPSQNNNTDHSHKTADPISFLPQEATLSEPKPTRNEYRPCKGWWSRTGSNRRPEACKATALPTELRPHDFCRAKTRCPTAACNKPQTGRASRSL